MENSPTHLLTDPDQRDVAAWNAWRNKHPLDPVFLISRDFQGVDLQGVNLSRTSLLGTDLSGANLAEANLFEAILAGSNFRGSSLRNAHMASVKAGDADFTEADLAGARLDNGIFHRAETSTANLKGAQMPGVIGLRHKDVLSSDGADDGPRTAYRDPDDGSITVWAFGGTFDSISASRKHIWHTSASRYDERLEWLTWVEHRLSGDGTPGSADRPGITLKQWGYYYVSAFIASLIVAGFLIAGDVWRSHHSGQWVSGMITGTVWGACIVGLDQGYGRQRSAGIQMRWWQAAATAVALVAGISGVEELLLWIFT